MSKPLKINILLYRPGLGGGDRVVAIYAEYLRRRGHDVILTALKPAPVAFKHQAAHFLRKGRLQTNAYSATHYDHLNIPVRLSKDPYVIDDGDLEDADVLLATFWRTAEWATEISPAKGAKAYFVQNYESAFPYSDPARVDETYRAPLKKIVISNWLDDLMRTKFGETPVARIANSVDTKQFTAPPRRKNDIPCVGLLYGDSPIKGVDVTVRAIDQIRRSIPNLNVVAFGSTAAGDGAPLPRGCEYHFEPAQDKIRDIYAKCDVWMCGSRVEGFHLPPMEAMACRCPVVSTSVGGPADVIENGRQGYLVPVEDAGQLAEKTLSILQASNEAWLKMSDAAYATATRYSWDDAGALFEAALRDVADGAAVQGAGMSPADGAAG